MLNSFQQYNETDTLQKVIIGRYRGYRKVEAYVERINQEQEKGFPSHSQLAEDFKALSDLLSDYNVEILHPSYVGKFVYDQLTPRDLGVTIGEKFVLCNMAKSSRRYEAAGIFKHILAMEGKEPTILLPPHPDILLEGGDLIVDHGNIFVGIGGRTNRAGFQYLKETFGESFNVVPLICQSTPENPVLHLDCTFNPVGNGYALIYRRGLEQIPETITETYTLITIDDDAQRALATNVLSLNPNTVVSRDHPACNSVNDALEVAGLTVETIPFDGPPATGGSFRCCTLPLVRS